MLASKVVFDFLDRVMYVNCNFNTIKGISIIKNVVYNEECPEICTADLYYKKETGKKYPVLLNIHGGGFVAGDKKYRLAFCKDMANQGLFVVNINYGLCPEYKFPDFLSHCIKALDFISDNADKYNLDLDTVLAAGDSAGAYIAAYLGALQCNPGLRNELKLNEPKTKLKALLLYCGPYQVEELLNKHIMLNFQAEIGSAFLDVPKADIIDISRIDGHKYRNLLNVPPYVNKDFPASFLTYAKNDFLCPDQGEAFLKLLETNGVKTAFHYGDKSRDLHCYHLFQHSSNGRKAMKATRAFIKDIIN